MTTTTKSRGFTIVELLIVIVIIAILAAITIVAYNGITARANASSAKSAAGAVIKKMEAFNADEGTGVYPATPAALTGAAATKTYQLTGVTFATGTLPTTAPATPNVLVFYSCTTGAAVAYWDYSSTATNKWTGMFTGGATALTVTSGVGCTYVAA